MSFIHSTEKIRKKLTATYPVSSSIILYTIELEGTYYSYFDEEIFNTYWPTISKSFHIKKALFQNTFIGIEPSLLMYRYSHSETVQTSFKRR